jgi:hypothetical protein
MKVTVSIHEAWLTRPEDLRRIMALLAGLEVPPPRASATPEASGPERHAPARPEPDRGDAWEPPMEEDPQEDQDTPRDGRQLLGWASKQNPDRKGIIIGYGKKRPVSSSTAAGISCLGRWTG